MNDFTQQDVINMISTQRLTNENFQLRDVVQSLQAALAGKEKMIDQLEKEAQEKEDQDG